VLEEFLDTKPLYYDEIDYMRMSRVYNRIKSHFKLPKIIHIIGTNGKGTTGRFLATALANIGYNTGHYTSPHIVSFNERIWFNGENVSMDILEDFHQELLSILTEDERDSLSYFEYTTFLAMLFFSQRCDYVVLEAGLGGEHDATATFENILTLVTPIDKDHEAFLGSTIEAIALTKLNAIQKSAIIGQQKHNEIYTIAERLQNTKEITFYRYESILQKDDFVTIDTIAFHEKLVMYLKQNLALAVAALKYLQIDYKEEDFYSAKLFGRLSKLDENILVDVGHNTLAAKAILESLKDKKYNLVYNSYKDKNYKEILAILKPIITKVELIDVYNARVEESGYIQKALQDLDIQYNKFEKIDAKESYLVFGSFSVVEAFLKVYRG